MTVAKQIFNSLTEYIQVTFEQIIDLPQQVVYYVCNTQSSPQGPCTGNQQSLAHSRLWDAIVGFLHVFAHMMMKLAQVHTYHQMYYTFQKENVIFVVSHKQNKTHCCFAAASCVDWAHWPHVTICVINSNRINLLRNFDLMANCIFSNFARNQW